MPRKGDVDEIDITLLDALHANPRISFERLGTALGVSPVTVARRWRRLCSSGQAWVSSVPGPRLDLAVAVVEVRASPGCTAQVAAELSRIPQVISVYATDGDFDLHTLVLASDIQALAHLVLDRVPGVDRVVQSRPHTGIRWYSATQWRLGAIDHRQKDTLGDGIPDTRNVSRDRVFEPLDHALFLALQHDGRARLRDVARDLDVSEDLIRRRLESLTRHGMLSFRTDFSRRAGGWPTEFVLWLSVPARQLDSVASEISTWPQTRICLAVVGTANLMVMAQVHRIADISVLLDKLERLDTVRSTDHRLVLRAVKSYGRLLDSEGNAVAVVPVDPWDHGSG